MCHVVVDGSGWKTETQWKADASLKGKLRYRYGLHCFTRTQEAITNLATSKGLALEHLVPVSQIAALDDDIGEQHLMVLTHQGNLEAESAVATGANGIPTERTIVEIARAE